MTKYKSEAFAAIHEDATTLYELGIIDKTTMREFDKDCLTPIDDLTPSDIKAIRENENMSQTVFAHYLNVSKNLISEWERGKKKPSGAATKLLTLVKDKGIMAIV